MAFRPGERVRPQLALNAIRVLTPPGTIPASVVPFDRALLHAYLDRAENDVFATRYGETDMAVVPLTPRANLPTDRMGLPAAEHLRLVSALTREAVFRLLAASPEADLLIRRRPPTVAGKRENVLAEDIGLPDWLKKRLVLEFDTRILRPPRGDAYVVLTCSKRLRTIIDASCRTLLELGVPLTGAAVSSWREDPDPKVSRRLAYAGRVVEVGQDTLTLDDHGAGPSVVSSGDVFLEPTRANFNKVVEVITQGNSERAFKAVQKAEAEWHDGRRTIEIVHGVLNQLGNRSMVLADGVPLRLGGLIDQAVDSDAFPPAEAVWRPKLSFDPVHSPETSNSWKQQSLDRTGPFDRQTFETKRPRIAVVHEAGRREEVAAAMRDFLHGRPDIASDTGLVPHGSGLLGRFRLHEPEVRYFEAAGRGGPAYADAARTALRDAASRDEPWDLAMVQVERAQQDWPHADSPYWMSKATFLKRDVPVQALSTEMLGLDAFGYANALANMSLATYAKLGGAPWLLVARSPTDHELVVGLGSHTVKEGRRGAGERFVGIATVFSSQGHYFLDARTAAVPFEAYPAALSDSIVDAIKRIGREEAWRPGEAIRLVFHAFTQLSRETVQAVEKAVAGIGATNVSFAFLHVVEDHPFTMFDRAWPDGKGAFAPERGQALRLSEREWLLTLTGRREVKSASHGLPGPVLLRLHDNSTYRDMPVLVRQASDFAFHSWRTFGPSGLPIPLVYADEIAKQLSGLERTPGWDTDAAEGGRVMRKPWFL